MRHLEPPHSMADELVDTLFILKETDQTIVGLCSSVHQSGDLCASVWCVVMRGSLEPASLSSASRPPVRPFPVPAAGSLQVGSSYDRGVLWANTLSGGGLFSHCRAQRPVCRRRPAARPCVARDSAEADSSCRCCGRRCQQLVVAIGPRPVTRVRRNVVSARLQDVLARVLGPQERSIAVRWSRGPGPHDARVNVTDPNRWATSQHVLCLPALPHSGLERRHQARRSGLEL